MIIIKDSTWKPGEASNKANNIFTGGREYVKDKGIWRENTDDPFPNHVFVFKLNPQASGSIGLTHAGLSGTAYYLDAMAANGSLVQSWEVSNANTNWVTLGPTVVYVGYRTRNVIPGANYGTGPSMYSANNFITEIVKLDKVGYRFPTYPVLAATGLLKVPKTIPDTVTSMQGAFWNCAVLNDPNFKEMDMSKVKTFTNMLRGTTAFNQDISGWNTAAATAWANFATDSGLLATPAYIPAKFR